MGYTHYWRRPRTLNAKRFAALVRDAQIIFEAVKEYGVLLAGPDGTGQPIANSKQIAFNGLSECGHPKNANIVIPWPSDDAGGVASHGEDAVAGSWFAGAQLSTRCCNGDCSYETFLLPRVLVPEGWQRPDTDKLYHDFCKTAYRPYDLAVTACLLIAKHHLGESFRVFTDGDDNLWWDTKLLCLSRLGYGSEYVFDGELGLVKGYFNLSDEIADANLAAAAAREQQDDSEANDLADD